MKTPEGREKDKIKKYLTEIGAWYFCPFMKGYGKNGVPDIVACINGRFVGIEVKREGKGPTKLQEQRGKEIQAIGGTWLCGTAEHVIPWLRACSSSRAA